MASNNNYQETRAIVKRKKSRRPKWNRIFMASGILLVVFITIICLIANAISNAKENNANAKFIEEQKQQEIIDFVTNESFEEISTPAEDCVWGIDVSHWQEGIVTENWIANAKAAGCSFIYIQFAKTPAEYSVDNPVSDYVTLAMQFADAAEANSIAFGFYFLTDAKNESERLTEFGFILQFLNQVKTKNYQYNRLPLMLDHEVYGTQESQESSDARILMIEKQVSALKQFGIETIIYTSASKYTELVAVLGEEQDFWLADYSKSQPGIAPTTFPEEYINLEQVGIWQYSADALSVQERGLSVVTDYNPDEQQCLDRNLMKTDFYHECINY